MRLVDNARQAWRWWSVRAAALAGLVVAYAIQSPQQLLALVQYVPEQWRPLASVATGFVAFALPTVLRVIQQDGSKDSD